MAKEVLDQVLGLLNGLTEKEIAKVHRRTKPKKNRLSPIEIVRNRQSHYKQDLRSGKALFGEKVR